MSTLIKEILNNGTTIEQKALFSFSIEDSDEKIELKFNLWARYFFIKYFSSKDALFHKEIDLDNIQAYKGDLSAFVDIAFRGAAKTARTKLFLAFAICNDINHFRRYMKILAADGANSKQIVTDIYNMLVNPRIQKMYPEIFEKTNAKREETMTSFTTSTGIKVASGTVGTDQRGNIMDEARPDLIWYEDFENRTTLRSAKKTKAIWENMEEARTGLAVRGSCIYTCNYISEQGNVHILVTKETKSKKVLIVPIIENGESAWPDRYTIPDIDQMRQDDEDFEGERLCKPSASKDILFDRETLDAMPIRQPIREVAGFKIFKKYDPSHRYGSGHDVAGGVGLDSSTSVFIDFDTFPAQVVATFKNNEIKPETFGDEIQRESDMFGGCIAGIEKNNHGHATIARARQLEIDLYKTQRKDTEVDQQKMSTEYGWHTNALTKPKMLFAFSKAVEDGLIELNDKDLIQECKSYTRNDLIENENDPRLTTRHFDLLIAACIAWQMKDFAEVSEEETEEEEEYHPQFSSIGI